MNGYRQSRINYMRSDGTGETLVVAAQDEQSALHKLAKANLKRAERKNAYYQSISRLECNKCASTAWVESGHTCTCGSCGEQRDNPRVIAQSQPKPKLKSKAKATTVPPVPVLLVSEQDREQVSELLARAVQQGYFDLEEQERRSEKAVAAKTRSDLQALLADLPARFQPTFQEQDQYTPQDASRLQSWLAQPTWVKLLTYSTSSATISFFVQQLIN